MHMLTLQLLTNVKIYSKRFAEEFKEVKENEEKVVKGPDENIFVSLEKDTIPDI